MTDPTPSDAALPADDTDIAEVNETPAPPAEDTSDPDAPNPEPTAG